MSYVFEITDAQTEKIKAWDKCANKYHGAIGGHLIYEFVPTGIGVLMGVRCAHCGDTLNLTDYDSI